MTDLDRFYQLLSKLAKLPREGRPLGSYSGKDDWPSRDVYFFFEPGEHRSCDPQQPRVVRVGTHAVSTGSKSSLWGRLRAHRGASDLGGNHRGSIFRLHVGAAMLQAEQATLATWGVKSSAPKHIRLGERTHEQKVSEYICRMPIVWVPIPDEPGAQSQRAFIERNAIALLSNGLHPLDPPSDSWLGRKSRRREISQSGLWNLNYVGDKHTPDFLNKLTTYVEAASNE